LAELKQDPAKEVGMFWCSCGILIFFFIWRVLRSFPSFVVASVKEYLERKLAGLANPTWMMVDCTMAAVLWGMDMDYKA
jgi:hypothetical protein